jgi:hypothetical protein
MTFISSNSPLHYSTQQTAANDVSKEAISVLHWQYAALFIDTLHSVCGCQ